MFFYVFCLFINHNTISTIFHHKNIKDNYYLFFNSLSWTYTPLRKCKTYCDITVCPGSSYPFYIVSYYIKWVTTSWAHSTNNKLWILQKKVKLSWHHKIHTIMIKNYTHNMIKYITQVNPFPGTLETWLPGQCVQLLIRVDMRLSTLEIFAVYG